MRFAARTTALSIGWTKPTQDKDADLWSIKGDPLPQSLEGDPRYSAFLRKMKLPH